MAHAALSAANVAFFLKDIIINIECPATGLVVLFCVWCGSGMANSFEESPLGELLAIEATCNVPLPQPPRPIPHYWGHRDRLRKRFREGGADALPDYELLELILFRAIPRRDVKPLAKDILARFGSFAEAVAAAPERLMEIEGVTDAVVTEIKIMQAAALRTSQSEVKKAAHLRGHVDGAGIPALGDGVRG